MDERQDSLKHYWEAIQISTNKCSISVPWKTLMEILTSLFSKINEKKKYIFNAKLNEYLMNWPGLLNKGYL